MDRPGGQRRPALDSSVSRNGLALAGDRARGRRHRSSQSFSSRRFRQCFRVCCRSSHSRRTPDSLGFARIRRWCFGLGSPRCSGCVRCGRDKYALAAALAAATLLLLKRRWRGAVYSLLAGVSLGHIVFRAVQQCHARRTADPDVRLKALLGDPGRPLPDQAPPGTASPTTGTRRPPTVPSDGLEVDSSRRSRHHLRPPPAPPLFLRHGAGRPAASRQRKSASRHHAVIGGKLVPSVRHSGFPLTRVCETRFFVPSSRLRVARRWRA